MSAFPPLHPGLLPGRHFGLGIVLLAGFFVRVGATDFPGRFSEGGSSVRRSNLDNGLTVVTQSDAASAVTVVEIIVKGGSRAEPAAKAGLSYLTTRIAAEIQDSDTARDFMVKALRTSVTSRDDASVIHLECLTEFADSALASFLKFLTDPLLTSIRLDRLTEAVNHQRRIQQDDAVNESRLAQREAFFGGTSSGLSIFGTDASLEALKPKDLKEFYSRLFVAGNMIVVAVSDLESDALLALIERHFKFLRPGIAPEGDAEAFSPKNPPYTARTIVKEQQQSVISCAFPLSPISRREYVLVSLIENILGRGPGSRLWALRTEKKLAYSVSAFATPFRQGGFFEAYLETDAAKTDTSKEALAVELRRFFEGGVTSEEFLAGRAVLQADFLRANETKSNRTSTLGFFESTGLGADFFDQFIVELAAVTIEETNAAVKRLLDPARASWVIVGPKR